MIFPPAYSFHGNNYFFTEIECEPNTTFKKDCNTCKCGDDGKMAVCTQRACLGNISKKPTGTTEESSGRNRRG